MHSAVVSQFERDRRSNWAGFGFFTCWTALNVVLATGVFRRNAVVALLLLPTFLHELLIAISFLVRKPLQRQAEGGLPRAAAYAASFLVPAFSFVAGRWQPAWMHPSGPVLFTTGVVLWMVGAYFGLWSLFRLRRAFSIVPQARTLVTGGPYRLARHPVYTSYLLQYGGMAVAYLTLMMAAVFLIWCGVMLARVRYEEQVLSTAFPEYAEYRKRVGRFMPRWRRIAGEGEGATLGSPAATFEPDRTRAITKSASTVVEM